MLISSGFLDMAFAQQLSFFKEKYYMVQNHASGLLKTRQS